MTKKVKTMCPMLTAGLTDRPDGQTRRVSEEAGYRLAPHLKPFYLSAL